MSNGVARQSLQEKVSLTLFVVMGVLAMLSYLTLQKVVAPTFGQLELAEARTNLTRAERAIQNDLDTLTAITRDWALWDDAYDYVRGEYPAFEDSNLERPTLNNLGLSLLAVYDADGRRIWGQLLYDGQEARLETLGVLDNDTNAADFLIRHRDPTARISGLLRTNLGPMLLSSWPVLRSDGSGPIAGTMLMGQFMDAARADGLRSRTEVNLRWTPIDSPEVMDGTIGVPLNIAGDASVNHTMSATEIVSSGVLTDLFGSPLLILEVSTPRNISTLGHSTVNGALALLALAAVVVAIVTWWLLRRIIVQPLAELADHIVAIRESGDLTRKVADARGDEIGALAREFDRLTDELQDARRLLLDQSFKAGKADTAAEVLHNIRNAMTPMINGIDRLARNFGVTGKLKVNQALGELSGTECPPERASKLLQYVQSAFAHVEASNQEAAANLEVASKQARQVEAILVDQERHAKAAPVVEKLSLDEVLDEAALVLPKADRPRIDLQMESAVRQKSVQAHRVALLQVMGNIILNAYESIQRSESASGCIRLTAREEWIDEQPMVCVTVVDTGCGFDEQTGGRIFQRGFSSKDGNMSGLGLHWCANAVAGMGGRIRAESPGPGKGAEFHVLLPAAQEATNGQANG